MCDQLGRSNGEVRRVQVGDWLLRLNWTLAPKCSRSFFTTTTAFFQCAARHARANCGKWQMYCSKFHPTYWGRLESWGWNSSASVQSAVRHARANCGKWQMYCSKFHQWLIHQYSTQNVWYCPYSLVRDPPNVLRVKKLWELCPTGSLVDQGGSPVLFRNLSP